MPTSTVSSAGPSMLCAGATCGCPCHHHAGTGVAGDLNFDDHHRSRDDCCRGVNGNNKQQVGGVSLEARVEDLEDQLGALLKNHRDLQQQLAAGETTRREEASANDELYRQLGALVGTTSALSERLKALESTTYSALQGAVGDQEGRLGQLEGDLASILESFKKELVFVKGSLEERAAALEKATGRLEEASEADVRKLVTTALDDFQKLQAQQAHDLSRRLDQELDRRHKRLVESTQTAVTEAAKGYETAAPQIRTLQNDVLTLRETLRQQGAAIEGQRGDTSVEAALGELRDWVQDVERKLVSRTEVEESILNITSQLSNLKHSTTTAEALLTQKLEVERTARESAVSQITAQVSANARRAR